MNQWTLNELTNYFFANVCARGCSASKAIIELAVSSQWSLESWQWLACTNGWVWRVNICGAGCSEVHIVYLRLPEFSAFIPSNPSPRAPQRTWMPFIEWLMKDEMCLLTFFCQSIVTQQNILKFATRFISRFLSEKFIRLQFIQMILVMSSILWIASGNFILSLIQGLVNASPCSASRILIYRSLQSIPLYFQCQRSGCCLESEEWNFCVPRPAAWLHRRDLVQDDRWDASALCWHPWGWSCDAWLHAWPNHFDSNSIRILQFQGNGWDASLSARIICRTQEERGAQYGLSAGWDGIICPSAPMKKVPGQK